MLNTTFSFLFLPFKRVLVRETEVKISQFVKKMGVWHLMSISAAPLVPATPFLSCEQQHAGPGNKEVRDLMGTAHCWPPGLGQNQFASNLSHQEAFLYSLPPTYIPQGDRRKGNQRVMDGLLMPGVNSVTTGDTFNPQSAASILKGRSCLCLCISSRCPF